MTDDRDLIADTEVAETDIAIIGMAGKFPGAPDVDRLWERVLAAEDCLVTFDEQWLLERGVSPATLADPNYVRRNGVLDDLEMFDAGFFGIGARDASIMDPQHRHFIECSWEALETSGHVPERFEGAIGVFAGCGMNTYMLNNLLTNEQLVRQLGMFLLRHTANDKDFLTTTLSYKLDLRGPSVNVQTACSTSLVAVHLAVQSLLAFECDLALAGGSTIEVPHRVGYEYQEGEVLSPDGYCRAFDERSAGTVLTSGVGVVALRRLADAQRDGDPILAVVKGTAINNDGQRKVGYLAPSVDGHADVVKEALAVAGLSGRDIGLLETHGTGTAVGDPIEVAALTEAFRASTPDTGFCRLVSTKPNIGHLDTAAGVASLIKAVQALRHRTLPPLANHTAPSPLLDLERTPFVLSTEATPWPGDRPRRVGVSSLGVGGTNAHVIVQEAPAEGPTPATHGEQVFVLSARETSVLDAASTRLADFLEEHPDVNLADAASTLATTRRPFAHRRVMTAPDVETAVTALRSNDRNRVATQVAPDEPLRVAFMFPGGGSQYVGMAAGLDERFEVFHETMRDGLAQLRERHGVDLEPLLSPDADEEALRHTTASLPAIFLTSIALARQWMAWGVQPSAFVGHSLGEYAAAHLAGVLTLDGALDLIVSRAALIERVSGSGAAMLAVPLPEAEVRAVLPPKLSLATINAHDECVVAGPVDEITALQAAITTDEVAPTLIPIAAAGHSSMLDPILPDFLDAVRKVALSPPRIPYLSNLTGTWITAEQATDPQYWVDHLRNTVRFAECLATVLEGGPLVLFELGPGHSLSSYARRQPTKPVAAIAALRHPNQHVDDTAATLLSFTRGWAAGLDVNIARFAGPGRRTVRLPGYPFKREFHWIEPGAGRAVEAAPVPLTAGSVEMAVAAPAEPQRIGDLAASFWAPTWIERPAVAPPVTPVGPWVIVGNPTDALVEELARQVVDRGAVVEVTASPHPAVLKAARSVVLVGPTDGFDSAVERWLTVASAAARTLGEVEAAPTLLAAVTREATDVDLPASHPVDAMATGIIGTAAREYPDLRTALIDLEAGGDVQAEAAAVIADLFGGEDRITAHRGRRRLVPTTEHLQLGPNPARAVTFRQGGNYLITGGLGGVGFALARHLAEDHDANLLLVATRPVPEGPDRAEWLDRHGYDDPTSRRIRRVEELEAIGTKVSVVVADLADPASLRAALDEGERQVGRLDGAIHAAGELRDKPIELATHDDHIAVIGAKARGALALTEELRRRGGELLVLVSSTSTVLVPEGQAAYVAANSVLDALAGDHGPLRVVTINYGLWGELGIAAAAAHRFRLGIEPGEPVVHPVFSELSVERDGVAHLVGTLAADHHWVVDEHRSAGGRALLPGTGHLELYLAGLDLAGIGPSALSTVTLLEPLVVPDDHPVTVRLTINPAQRTAQLESDGAVGEWRTHSEALIIDRPPNRSIGAPTRPDGAETIDPLQRPASQLELGGRWHSVVDAWSTGNQRAGRLQLPSEFVNDDGAWWAHPALVDTATAFAVSLGSRVDALYVPVGYDEVVRWGDVPTSLQVMATREGPADGDLLRVDLVLFDDAGTPVLAIDGLSLRPMDDAAALAVPSAATALEPAKHHRIPPLVALAERHGIRAAEGAELLERVVGSRRPRLIATSISLDDLTTLVVPAPPTAPAPAVGVPAVAPAGASVLATIRGIWVDLLGVPDVGDDDDFFDVGGHSLIAIRLMSRIHKELGVRFQLVTIFDAPTIAGLTAKVLEIRPDLDAELAAAAAATTVVTVPGEAPTAALAGATTTVASGYEPLVTISATGDKAPLFIVHGAGGNVLFLWSLARAMSGTRPIYGFQAHGVDGHDMPDATIEEMATRYVTALRAAHRGPYLIGGYSGGGIVTFEMVRQLQALGEEVKYVVFFDSVPPGRATPSRSDETRNLWANVRRHGYAKVRPFLKEWAKAKAKRFLPTSAGREMHISADERELGMRDVESLGFVNLFFYFSAAADKYVMSTIDVNAAILKVEWVWPIQPHDYYWGQYIRGRLDIAEVPGDHNAMFYPENAPRLAEVLMPLLDANEP